MDARVVQIERVTMTRTFSNFSVPIQKKKGVTQKKYGSLFTCDRTIFHQLKFAPPAREVRPTDAPNSSIAKSIWKKGDQARIVEDHMAELRGC